MVTSSFLWTRATIDEQAVQRPYTPISKESEPGHFDLIVKRYAYYALEGNMTVKPSDTTHHTALTHS
jgi:hypothetical protein